MNDLFQVVVGAQGRHSDGPPAINRSHRGNSPNEADAYVDAYSSLNQPVRIRKTLINAGRFLRGSYGTGFPAFLRMVMSDARPLQVTQQTALRVAWAIWQSWISDHMPAGTRTVDMLSASQREELLSVYLSNRMRAFIRIAQVPKDLVVRKMAHSIGRLYDGDQPLPPMEAGHAWSSGNVAIGRIPEQHQDGFTRSIPGEYGATRLSRHSTPDSLAR